MREEIRQMLETNTCDWSVVRKHLTAEEIVEVYDLHEAEGLEVYTQSGWIPFSRTCPIFPTIIIRLKPLPPVKKEAKRYPVKLVVNVHSPEYDWCGGYWEVEYADNCYMTVDFIYAAGKTAVWHFADNSTGPVFRKKNMVAVELSFQEDNE